MTEEADPAASPGQAGVLLEDSGVFDGVEVRIQDGTAVEPDHYATSVGGNLLFVPLPRRSKRIGRRRRENIVYGPVILSRLQAAAIAFVVVIEDLNLHAAVSDIALERRADTDTVVAARLHPELEAEDEIGVFLLRQEIATAVRRANEQTIFHDVTAARVPLLHKGPTVESLAVEERDKPRFGRAEAERHSEQDSDERQHDFPYCANLGLAPVAVFATRCSRTLARACRTGSGNPAMRRSARAWICFTTSGFSGPTS